MKSVDLGHCSKEKVGLDSEKEADQEHLAKRLLKSGIETGSWEKLGKDQYCSCLSHPNGKLDQDTVRGRL